MIFLFCTLDDNEEIQKPVICLFGVNAEGNSVCAHIHNFMPYFYVHVQEKKNESIVLTNEEIEKFRI